MKKVVYLKLLDFKELDLITTQDHIEFLANIISDILVSLEQEAIGTSKDQFYMSRIRTLMDVYAEEFDEILRKHRVSMVNEIKKLMTSLLDDLEKIINYRKGGNAELKKQPLYKSIS